MNFIDDGNINVFFRNFFRFNFNKVSNKSFLKILKGLNTFKSFEEMEEIAAVREK